MKYFANVKSMELFRCFVVPTLIVCVIVDTPFMQMLTLSCSALWFAVCMIRTIRRAGNRVISKMDEKNDSKNDEQTEETVLENSGKIRNLNAVRKKISAQNEENCS